MHANLLVGGTLVELDPPRVVRADLLLAGDRIADLGTDIPTTTTVDCTGCLIMPGLVLGHTHLYGALAAGMPAPSVAPTSFREILERVWWRLDRALDAETLAASALIAAMAALKAGVTTIIDHHESPNFIDGSLDVIAHALREVGLRGLLCYGATDRHGEAGAKAGLRENERFIEASKSDPLLKGAVGLHAPFTTSDATLEAAAALAKQKGAWLHYHAAEGPDDQQAAAERWSSRLLPKLDSLGLLGERSLLAHAVQIDDAERDLIATRGAWVAHQPRSNMNNGVGHAQRVLNLPKLVLGTDGIDQDPRRELETACFRAREATGPAVWTDPNRLLSGGHKLARQIFDRPFGSLLPGAPADVTILAYEPPTPLSSSNLSGQLLFGIASAPVRDVFVGGRVLLRNRRLVGLDERAALSRAQLAAADLWKRMESL